MNLYSLVLNRNKLKLA